MKVSVCVPFYNAVAYMGKCARPLLTQRDVDLECVFVDDGSTDDGAAVLERTLGELDPSHARSRLIRLPENRGRVAARFAALMSATGDYVGFCDADDWVEPDCYAKLLAAAEREDADAAVCAYCDVAADGAKSAPRRVSAFCTDPQEFISHSFYSPGFNSLCNKIFRTSLARRWLDDEMPDLCVGEDLLMTMRFLSRARRLAFVDEPLYCYRKTERSVSREISRRTLSDMISCIRLLAEEFAVVPKPALDVMRVHALWAACRCRDFGNGEVASLAREFAIGFSDVRDVPTVKRRLLPLLSASVGGVRRLVRGIEWARGLAS